MPQPLHLQGLESLWKPRWRKYKVWLGKVMLQWRHCQSLSSFCTLLLLLLLFLLLQVLLTILTGLGEEAAGRFRFGDVPDFRLLMWMTSGSGWFRCWCFCCCCCCCPLMLKSFAWSWSSAWNLKYFVIRICSCQFVNNVLKNSNELNEVGYKLRNDNDRNYFWVTGVKIIFWTYNFDHNFDACHLWFRPL